MVDKFVLRAFNVLTDVFNPPTVLCKGIKELIKSVLMVLIISPSCLFIYTNVPAILLRS